MAAETATLKASNEETLRIREEQSKKEAEDDLMYQRLYAEKLAKQEVGELPELANLLVRGNYAAVKALVWNEGAMK